MPKTSLIKTSALALAAFALLAGAAAPASARTWAQNHPRRDEVNDRLAHQSNRINREYYEGDLSRSQARQLHRDDHQVRQEERLMARQDGGHITRLDQRALNQQENQLSREIGH